MTDLIPELRDQMRRAAAAAQADRDRVHEAEDRGEKPWASIEIVHGFQAATPPANIIALLDAVDRLERELDEARGCLEGARASATAFRKDWEECNAALTAARESQREMVSVLARVVEIAGRNEASPDIEKARRLLAAEGVAHG